MHCLQATGKYPVCRRDREFFSPEILHAAAVKGLRHSSPSHWQSSFDGVNTCVYKSVHLLIPVEDTLSPFLLGCTEMSVGTSGTR